MGGTVRAAKQVREFDARLPQPILCLVPPPS